MAHTGLPDLRVVSSMHERKALMDDLADGFVALPGGIGTMEELFEVWTWCQLGLHVKPAVLLEVAGFYEPLVGFLDHATVDARLRAPRAPDARAADGHRRRRRSPSPRSPVPDTPHKWLDRDGTRRPAAASVRSTQGCCVHSVRSTKCPRANARG